MFSQNLTIIKNLSVQHDKQMNIKCSYDIDDFSFHMNYPIKKRDDKSYVKTYIQGLTNKIVDCVEIDLNQKVKFLEEINNIFQNIDKDIIN